MNKFSIAFACFLILLQQITAEECFVKKEKDPGVISQEPCVFPFIYKGVTYNTCTYVDHPEQMEWCSTKVDENGNHVTGGENWGVCRGDYLTCPREKTCPPSWAHLETGCYKILDKNMNRETAREQCSIHGGYLADISNRKELDTLNRWYKEDIQSECLYQTDSLWIGIKKETVKGPWISEHTGEEISYNHWLDTEPGNHGGNETFLKEACAGIFANRYIDEKIPRSKNLNI